MLIDLRRGEEWILGGVGACINVVVRINDRVCWPSHGFITLFFQGITKGSVSDKAVPPARKIQKIKQKKTTEEINHHIT